MNNKQRNTIIVGVVVLVLYTLGSVPWGGYKTGWTEPVRTRTVRRGVFKPPRGDTYLWFKIDYGQLALEVGVLAVAVGGITLWLKDE